MKADILDLIKNIEEKNFIFSTHVLEENIIMVLFNYNKDKQASIFVLCKILLKNVLST